ncbi:DNA-binding response regulator [Rhodovulum sulfidophilum]|uniref:Response regulator transcription factor n=1 Tax=Rhodovulum sulfidophilum TaxID=35806 RepID=A0ABS1RPV9_RHOSU|nr:response regulator transcription factor [Rhodovulum sulfidophilum]MBK5923295.1 DNA-binding response regulator [Rhodovulum sulfidophilum]MBL3583838.1 response regulator transcription factor [Rhodovulum sulfidophilum]MBL3608091.1 response regulator transcription factor [Rhodovulum sulfidophilum]MCE8457494.1 response regulator transcription factor [Rhodovulum sulfidophilum]
MSPDPIRPTVPRRFASAMVIDDHPLFCDALSMTLKSAVGIGKVETSDHLEDALSRLDRAPRPDIVLLDLNLPDVSGLDGLIRLKTAVGDIPVIVVSSMADPRIIGSAIRAGAIGFVPKHSPRDVFRAAFAAIAEGTVYVPEGIELGDPGQTAATGRDDAIRRLALLTPQQGRILQAICAGKLNKQIAFDLSIAETTVKAHVTAIMRKLGVQSRTQAVLIAQEASFSGVMSDPG